MQKEYFMILDGFFKKVTGKSANKFSTPENFIADVQRSSSKIGKRFPDAYNQAIDELIPFYEKYKNSAFTEGKSFGGLKYVVGGGSKFTKSHIPSLKKMLLYSDTIYIPDPVLPWIESERTEEKYRYAAFLENVFMILQLKPLVDAELEYPAIFVFPSYEKSLERDDETTKQQINALMTNFLSYYTGNNFYSIEETIEYITKYETKFLEIVDERHLFVPMGDNLSIRLNEALQEYKSYILNQRSGEYVEKTTQFSDGMLIWLGIIEKLAPQFHLLENSDAFGANPMIVFESQWHYFTLCSQMLQGQLEQAGILQPTTLHTFQALQQPDFEWLGNIPIEIIAELREENANEEFRRKLSEFTSALHNSNGENLDRVSAEVGRGIASLLQEHKKQVREIQEKYQHSHATTAVMSWATLGAIFAPWIAPYIGLPALTVVGKYAHDKYKEHLEEKQLSHSLLGVLAKAKAGSNY